MIRAFLVLVMLSFTYPLQVVDSVSQSNISWSPDVVWIAYLDEEHGNDLFVMNADGSDVTGVCAGRDAEWMPDGKTIACVVDNPSGGDDMLLVNAGGSNPRTVFSDEVGIYQPSWSPDGRSVVYEHDYYTDDGQLWMAGIEDKSTAPLTSGPGRSSSPAWSPDGTQIAYVRRTDPDEVTDEIRLVDRDGQNDRLLTSTINLWVGPLWSPDGKEIAYHRYDYQAKVHEIRLVDPTSQTDRLLTAPADVKSCGVVLTWSPDSEYILFATPCADENGLYVIGRDGTGLRTLDHGGRSFFRTWSAKGDTLAYGRGNELWTVRIPDGTAEKYAAFGEDILVEWVDWSPDNTAIAVGTWHPQTTSIYEIYTVEDEGAEPVKISHDTRNESEPVWSADGSQLLFLSTREHNQKVCLTNPYGRQKHCVASMARIHREVGPSWSSDGRHLVIGGSEYDRAEQDVFLIDASGSGAVNLTPSDQGEGGKFVLRFPRMARASSLFAALLTSGRSGRWTPTAATKPN